MIMNKDKISTIISLICLPFVIYFSFRDCLSCSSKKAADTESETVVSQSVPVDSSAQSAASQENTQSIENNKDLPSWLYGTWSISYTDVNPVTNMPFQSGEVLRIEKETINCISVIIDSNGQRTGNTHLYTEFYISDGQLNLKEDDGTCTFFTLDMVNERLGFDESKDLWMTKSAE
jgi:hypothetical protein